MESDEEMYITQNTFKSSEITESDIISQEGSEGRFDRLLSDTEIQKRVRQCVPAATKYKDEWASRAFET